MDAILKKRQMTFELGYIEGRKTGRFVSNREVAERYPHMTNEMIEIYQNGRDDGVFGDTWRLDQGRAAMKTTA